MRRLFFSIFLLCSVFAWSIEVKSLTITDEIRWSLETTAGWQNITNMRMAKEDGGSTQVKQALDFKGILFHSFWKGIQTLKSQLNLGFDQRTRFLWTDEPDFNHEEEHLNEHLRCTEFDIQGMLPFRATYYLTISPYVGYSFIEHSYDDNFSGIEQTTMVYNSMVVGVSAQHRFSKNIAYSYFFSYSPIVFENYTKSKTQFINYGAEIKTNTHPLSITLFLTAKRAFMHQDGKIFEGTQFNFTTAEAGFSLHLNLR